MTGAQFFKASMDKLAGSGIDLNDIAGFMAEPYQGWCAVFFPKDYMTAMRRWATEHDALLGFDRSRQASAAPAKCLDLSTST